MLMHMKGRDTLYLVECAASQYPHLLLAKQDALRAAVPPQSSRANGCCRVLSGEATDAHARSNYGAGQGSRVCAHRITARGAFKGIWHQRDPSSQHQGVPKVPPVVPVRLHAFDLGESHPESRVVRVVSVIAPAVIRGRFLSGMGLSQGPGSIQPNFIQPSPSVPHANAQSLLQLLRHSKSPKDHDSRHFRSLIRTPNLCLKFEIN
jgi:hypothetical protein